MSGAAKKSSINRSCFPVEPAEQNSYFAAFLLYEGKFLGEQT